MMQWQGIGTPCLELLRRSAERVAQRGQRSFEKRTAVQWSGKAITGIAMALRSTALQRNCWASISTAMAWVAWRRDGCEKKSLARRWQRLAMTRNGKGWRGIEMQRKSRALIGLAKERQRGARQYTAGAEKWIESHRCVEH